MGLNAVSAEVATGELPSFKEPRILGNWVLWVEQRPSEGGRSTLLIRPWGCTSFPGQELTPAPSNLRSGVHGYGGGVFAAALDKGQIIISWIDDSDASLWIQSFEQNDQARELEAQWVKSVSPKSCLASGQCLADGFLDLKRRRWIGVMEKDHKDFLVTYSIDETNQTPIVLHSPADFIGYASLNRDGDQLVWIEWQRPAMPWDASQLWWALLDQSGAIKEKSLIAGNGFDHKIGISVFNPLWLPSGQIVVAEDSNGWWNLILSDLKTVGQMPSSWQRKWPMEAECGVPQWIYGMSTASVAGNQVLSATCDKGLWRLSLLHLDGCVTEINQPFDDLSGINSSSDRAVAIASNSLNTPGILEIELNNFTWQYATPQDKMINDSDVSIGESFWFKGWNGEWTHAWYYLATQPLDRAKPLLVRCHSGPTSMNSRGLNLSIQFWTSRGWSVVDVNYGGSTGFGKAYRDRLKFNWGKVDVFDCVAVAEELVKQGKASRELIAVEGGSAGGFTALKCLCDSKLFRVGACRYPVCDLNAMTEDTHRFESGYLDYLVGLLPGNRLIYEQRSPLNKVEHISSPVIFFQGLKDKVVLPNQTKMMASVLKRHDIPVELYTFPNEGHGFKDSKIKVQVLKKTEKFFRQHLGF